MYMFLRTLVEESPPVSLTLKVIVYNTYHQYSFLKNLTYLFTYSLSHLVTYFRFSALTTYLFNL